MAAMWQGVIASIKPTLLKRQTMRRLTFVSLLALIVATVLIFHINDHLHLNLKAYKELPVDSIGEAYFPGTYFGDSNTSGIDATNCAKIPSLLDLCASKTWNQNLWFVCDDNAGGVGNEINLILACVRYAVQAGAGITLPLLQRRGKILTALKEGTLEPLEYMFDVQWFRDSLHQSCPQMKVVETVQDIESLGAQNAKSVLQPLKLHPDDAIRNAHVDTFAEDVMTWLNRTLPSDAADIVHVSLAPFEWPVNHDSDEFYYEFGKLIRLRPDVYTLAKRAIQVLRSQVSEGLFLGGHLRNEADVRDFGLPYSKQRDALIADAQAQGLQTIYLATGDLQDVERFRVDAAVQGISTRTKHTLLSKDDLNYLEALSWDQQALVDYLVLRESTYFVGQTLSSFSFALAYSRHLDIKNERFPFPQDGLSRINGDNVGFFDGGMWPI